MKKILLLSDTHGFVDSQILKFVKEADEVWHAGDIGSYEVIDAIKKYKPLRAVYGNIDNNLMQQEFPLDNKFNIENVTVWMTHIGGYPSKYNPRIKKDIAIEKPTLFISGHSHILKVMFDKKLGVLHMNPGAAGKNGFHTIRTMLRFNINNDKIEALEVIELGNR
jgi:putative phosphoesterase